MADIETTMDDLLACVVEGLEAADRPVCDSGFTIGVPEIASHRCCECPSGGGNGQAIAYLERFYPVANGITFDQETRLENCRPGAIAADITILVIRCYPRINAKGEMPKLDKTTVAANDLNLDMNATWNALKCCGSVAIRESGIIADPDAGCSALGIQVTTLISLPPVVGVGS